MMKRVLILAALSLALAACGVKTDLVMPNGKPTPANQTDPSKPPQPLGR
ncbi:MAG: lipoprotein [Alphaproteobacteria bacterium]|nr:lipoprotein [Alphaproteobacteria bacterium]MDE2013948.1 lipoprotein [Alphaproteobacteria bacterium]MDE2073765.1 lipoprotein [Alphaproteobacteria bacterium]MDE2351029.1 lipoprotein [Alphaproteobacteria bacterium]